MDDAFNRVWDFDTDTVTDHMTLYAKWDVAYTTQELFDSVEMYLLKKDPPLISSADLEDYYKGTIDITTLLNLKSELLNPTQP